MISGLARRWVESDSTTHTIAVWNGPPVTFEDVPDDFDFAAPPCTVHVKAEEPSCAAHPETIVKGCPDCIIWEAWLALPDVESDDDCKECKLHAANDKDEDECCGTEFKMSERNSAVSKRYGLAPRARKAKVKK